MIKRIFHAKVSSIATAAMLVAFSSLASRLLGVLRDRILAGSFGASDTLDIYYAAFRLPDTLYNLLVLGALSAGFIPLFVKKIREDHEDQKEAWSVANNLINILGFSLLLVALLGMAFSQPLMRIFAPGFSADKQMLTAELSRIMFLSPFIMGLSGLVGGILQSFKRFLIYSLAPIFYNIGIIFGALYLVPKYGVRGLAWGVVLGALMHLLIQVPTLRHLGYRYQWLFDIKAAEVRQIVRLMIPRTLALAVAQIDLIVSTAIASTLAVGSLAVFNFANNLQYFPIGIFGISFATAAFPTLSANAHNPKKMIESFSKVIRQILFFIIPASVIFFLLRSQIIKVVLGTGAFGDSAIIMTSKTLGLFLVSLFAQASIPLLVRMFYAREDSMRPFVLGMITVAIDIVLALTLSKAMGVGGIALAYSISNIVNFLLLWLVLENLIGDLDKKNIGLALSRFFAAGISSGLFVYGVTFVYGRMVHSASMFSVLIEGILAGGFGLLMYLMVALFLRSEEASGLVSAFQKKLRWSAAREADLTEARGL